MKIGDRARSTHDRAWIAKITGVSKYGYRVVWETGPLAGREANPIKSSLVPTKEK